MQRDAAIFHSHISDDLIWSPADQVGFYDVDAHLAAAGVTHVYGEAYFRKYVEMDTAPMAEALNLFRVNMALLVLQGIPGKPARVLDVGIGGGGFLKMLQQNEDRAPHRLDIQGVDINPFAIQWLERRGMLGSLDFHYDLVTFWDSLEHFRDPAVPLQAVGRAAIVSLPIFRDADHVLESKHYRKDEHFWYFTRTGFIRWAKRQGFAVTDVRIHESLLGREDIETFVLQREYP